MNTRDALTQSLAESDEEIVALLSLEAEAEPFAAQGARENGLVVPRAQLRVLTRLAAQALALHNAPRAHLHAVYLDEEGDTVAKFTIANNAIARQLGAQLFTTLALAPPPFTATASNDAQEQPGRGVASREDHR
jgi:hypothetical protein